MNRSTPERLFVYLILMTLGLFGGIIGVAYWKERHPSKAVHTVTARPAGTGRERMRPIVWVQPTGRIRTVLPKRLLVYTSRAVDTAPGTTVDLASAARCVQLDPAVSGRIVWRSLRSMEILLDHPLAPATVYTVRIDCLPVRSFRTVPVPATTYTIETPAPAILQAAPVRWTSRVITVQIAATLPLQHVGVDPYIEVYDPRNGTEVPILHVRSGPQPETLRVAFTATGSNRYTIRIRAGMPTAWPNVSFSRTVTLTVTAPMRKLWIRKVTVREHVDGFALTVDYRCASGAGGFGPCVIREEDFRTHLQIDPETPYTVVLGPLQAVITGTFLPDHHYRVTIRAGLTGTDGATLLEDSRWEIQIPKPTPRLQVPVRGIYLGRQQGVRIPVEVAYTDTIELSVHRIPPRSAVVWQLFRRSYVADRLLEPIVTDTVIPVDATDGKTLQMVNLQPWIHTGEGGIYRIRLHVPGTPRWASPGFTEIWLVVSDIVLIAKTAATTMTVWSVRADTGKPLAHTRIRVYSAQNVQMAACTTNPKGYCTVAFSRERQRAPYLIEARNGSDWTFMHLTSSTIGLEPFHVTGTHDWTTNVIPYLYPERDLYRPGETLHFAVMVREAGTYRALAIPVLIRIRDPRGEIVTELTATTESYGMAEFTYAVPKNAPTGRYTVELRIGDRTVASQAVFIETFVPETMTVRVESEPLTYTRDTHPRFRIHAAYLFGAPAASARFRLTCIYRPVRFTHQKFHDYVFGLPVPATVRVQKQSIEGRLDTHGQAVQTCSVPDPDERTRPLRVTGHVSVSDPGGRPAHGETSVVWLPYDRWIGLRVRTPRIQPGRAVHVDGVVIDTRGQPVTEPQTLAYQIFQIHWNYVRTGYRWEPVRQKTPVSDVREVTPRNGTFALTFHPRDYWYDYVIAVWDPHTGSRTELELRGWGWWDTRAERPPSPEILEITLDRKTADYGDTVEAAALLPFSGRILWTVETDRIVTHTWQDASGDVARFRFRVPDRAPTVYVSALLFRTDSQYLIRRAFGVRRLVIRPKRHRLHLNVQVPERIAPGQPLEVGLRSDRPFAATVAVVDEGILQLTRFRSPNPIDGIFDGWPLVLRTAETFGWVIPKVWTESGGGMPGPEERVRPTFTRIVAYWSGLRKSTADGRLRVRFALPNHIGRLRVMVVAANDVQFVGTERSVRVTTDVNVIATLPRFVHAGDRFTFPVRLISTVDRPETVRVNVTGTGFRSEDGPVPVRLAARASTTVWIPVTVTATTGTLQATVRAQWSRGAYSDTYTLTVHPRAPFVRRTETLNSAVAPIDLRALAADWFPDDHRMTVTVTPFSGFAALMHIRSLIHYPYGCVEQTASALLPLIHLQNVLQLVEPDPDAAASIHNFIQAGIARLIAMQTPDGGFAYWPGDDTPTKWASVYATFVLLHARNAGYPVPETVLRRALGYIERYARAQPFGYLVLAMGGRLQSTDVDRMMDALAAPSPSLEDRLFLVGALALIGRRDLAGPAMQALLGVVPSAQRRLKGDFYSPLRAQSLRTYVLQLVDPDHPALRAHVHNLVGALNKPGQFYNTQELAWSLLAIGRYFTRHRPATAWTARLVLDGREVQPVRTTRWATTWHLRNVHRFRTARLAVSAETPVDIVITQEGFHRQVEYRPERHGLTVQRRYHPVPEMSHTPLQPGDLVLVEITVRNHTGRVLDNVAIEDPAPAGMEIVHPRLVTALYTALANTATSDWQPDYVDVRDDRMLVFGTIPPEGATIRYILRATIPGTFFVSPPLTTVMYAPEIHAVGTTLTVTIER